MNTVVDLSPREALKNFFGFICVLLWLFFFCFLVDNKHFFHISNGFRCLLCGRLGLAIQRLNAESRATLCATLYEGKAVELGGFRA
jgi:hypothetical protein